MRRPKSTDLNKIKDRELTPYQLSAGTAWYIGYSNYNAIGGGGNTQGLGICIVSENMYSLQI